MKRITAVLLLTALLCGCSQERKPIPQLPPAPERVKTPSTYTGTTVEFYYMPTSPTRPTEPTGYSMPDFPGFDEADNPFNETFSDMFTGIFPETEVTSEKTSSETARRVTAAPAPTETAAVTSVPESAEEPAETVTASVTLSENRLGPAVSMAPATPAAPTAAIPAPSESLTMPPAESFDIKDFMPSDIDFPEFTTFDINKFY